MLIQPHPAAPLTKWKWEREWERHKSLKGIQKHYSFSNCFRHSKYSNISAGLLCLLYSSEVLLGSLWETCWREAKQQGGGGGHKGSGSEPRRRWRDQPLYARSSQGSRFTVAPAEVWGRGGVGWGGYFIYHFHFQLDCPPPPPTPNPSSARHASSSF